MTSNLIVLPTLSRWAEQGITALFQATDEKTFNDIYDHTFTKDAKIIVNGKHLSGDEYRKQIWRGKAIESGAQVTFTGVVEVPDDAHNSFNSGNVGLFLQATIEDKFLVLGAPESSTVTASYNLTIVQDPSAPHPPPHVKGGNYDARRVAVLSKVTVDKRNPVGPILPPVNSGSA